MSKIFKSILGSKKQDVIYVPQKEVNLEDSKKELPDNNKIEETIKSLNAQKKVEEMSKKEEKDEDKENVNETKDTTQKEKVEEKKTFIFKETVYKTLTILLIEDSKQMYEYNKEIVELAKRSIGDNLVMIIHYGEELENPGLYFPGQADEEEIICVNKNGTSLAFFDAIAHLDEVVTYYYFRTIEGKAKKYSIEDIEILGFSTGVDNSSKTEMKDAYSKFEKIIQRAHVSNKCFCLTEDNFINLASIGFRSIGRIKTNF